jgi:hypothetical protein
MASVVLFPSNLKKKTKKKKELMHCVYLIEAGIEIVQIQRQH